MSEFPIIDKVTAHAAPDGECLIWKGGLAAGSCPSCRINGKTVAVRRALWEAMGNVLPPKGKGAIVAKCKEDRCVAPEHLISKRRGTKKGTKRPTSTRVRMSKGRRSVSRLTEADVSAIRASTATQKVLAEQYNVCRRTIGDIKSGQTWAPLSNPFAGLIK
jgi:hypothetical protein